MSNEAPEPVSAASQREIGNRKLETGSKEKPEVMYKSTSNNHQVVIIKLFIYIHPHFLANHTLK
ncbi:hypothetical protein CGRA01v4_00444 [Colletotrichum graminicola]|nr:hypothetical protein CGRA01v4_00444 [Colletotrichum graminicola]